MENKRTRRQPQRYGSIQEDPVTKRIREAYHRVVEVPAEQEEEYIPRQIPRQSIMPVHYIDDLTGEKEYEFVEPFTFEFEEQEIHNYNCDPGLWPSGGPQTELDRLYIDSVVAKRAWDLEHR